MPPTTAALSGENATHYSNADVPNCNAFRTGGVCRRCRLFVAFSGDSPYDA
jgi:hypothetical protein